MWIKESFMKKSWYKLDNSANLFPAVANSKNSSVFRVSMILDHKIDCKKLQDASMKVYECYPMFMVELKKGLFWNYLNSLDHPIQVVYETEYPCRSFDFEMSRDLIRILYGNNRISVEVFHTLTDGTGAAEFLKSLVYFYLEGTDTEGKIRVSSQDNQEDYEDSYLKNYRPHFNVKKKLPFAYHITGESYINGGNCAIHGQLEVNEVHKIAKSMDVSITMFLSSVLIRAIALETDQSKGKPIVVSIPVNLRKHFNSHTLSNFFGVANVGVVWEDTLTDKTVLNSVKEQLQYELSPYSLQGIISNNVAYEKIPGASLVPLAIKNRIISLASFFLGENTKTVTLSNVGIVSMPESLDERILGMEVLLYPTKKSPINCGVITHNNQMTISFINRNKDNAVIKRFFTLLSQEYQLNISVYANEWKGDYDEKMF